jgi:hypothetical protein
MTTKLNLTVKEKTAKDIKSYAAKRKVSVSKLAEQHFDSLVNAEKKNDYFRKFLDKYAGSIKRKKPIDLEKEKEKYLKDKYGR